jgi:hypothetical protein
MNALNLLISKNPNFRFVQVIFKRSPQVYTYKTMDSSIVEGDLLIVNSPNSGLVIVKTVGVLEPSQVAQDTPYKFKWIVQKICTKTYEENNKTEQLISNVIEKATHKGMVVELTDSLVAAFGKDTFNKIDDLNSNFK